MIPQKCKRLAEVDFPIAAVGLHSAREKPIVRRHPQAFHQWWARRPLAACRAMLLALLLPDPCDPLCPEGFKVDARDLLSEPMTLWKQPGKTDEDLRKSLVSFIGEFANWDVAADHLFLRVGRGLVKAAHSEGTPLVVDPFAGGGSIPLEALRLGCETFASDLNPVACLILKVMLEDIPRRGPDIAEELRHVGAKIKAAAEKELGKFYPADKDGARPIAYLWARTVRCESPNCGAEIPLVRSFWLCKKANRRRALQYKIIGPKGGASGIDFDIFEPKTEGEVPGGTVTRAKATCLCCGIVLPPERVRAQLAAQRGGADVIIDEKGQRIGGARLLAVVTLTPEEQGRQYRLPTPRDYESVWNAQTRLEKLASERLPNGLRPVPDEPTPAGGGSGAGRAFSVQKYGMMTFGDLFTARQKLNLCVLAELVRSNPDLSDAIRFLLAFVVSRTADRLANLVGWDTNGEKVDHVFKRQALPMTWDFAEGVPLARASGGLDGIFEQITGTVESWAATNRRIGQAIMANAADHSLPADAGTIWFTDPPYYDAVPYADLSDFFFVWLKRTLPDQALLRDPFDPANPLTPKEHEAVQDETKSFEGRPKDRAFFEEVMARAFAKGAQILHSDGVGSVVFAHKTTEGWEALLTGMIRGGWMITASWPISTERPNRLRARDSAALAASVHLVCRPRPVNALVGDWSEVLHGNKQKGLKGLAECVANWMGRLQAEGVRGADLVFACIGPALEIYSRYSRVVDAEEREIPLGGDPEASEPHKRGFLAYVWEVVGRTALEQVLGTAEARAWNSAAGALEEDARLTALFLWTLQSTNGGQATNETDESENEPEEAEEEEVPRKKKAGFSLIFDVVRRFAQPLGIHLPEWEGRIIETTKGVVRLLPIGERSRQLFGEEGASAVADRIEQTPTGQIQLALFTDSAVEPEIKGRGRGRKRAAANVGDEALRTRREATTLDRIHAAMLLQAGGRTNALRALLEAEQQRGPDFLRLANALSALYPKDSEEKRLLDAMLLAVPRG